MKGVVHVGRMERLIDAAPGTGPYLAYPSHLMVWYNILQQPSSMFYEGTTHLSRSFYFLYSAAPPPSRFEREFCCHQLANYIPKIKKKKKKDHNRSITITYITTCIHMAY